LDRRRDRSGRFSCTFLPTPIPGQQFVDALGGMTRQSGQYVGEPGVWVDVVEFGSGDQRVDGGSV
jgi:hypothetical protein